MNTNIERCELAPGLHISRVLTGLWQIADMERDGTLLNPELAATLLASYADAGFTTFDMADHYGSAEIIAGRFRQTRDPNQPVQLLTKWVPTPGPVTRDEVRSAVQRGLDRLQTDSIDLMQFHAWNYADPRWLDCLFWLQELKQQGLIRHLGLTNFDTAHLRITVHSGIKIVSNQVCFSLIDQRPQQRMAELCLQHDIKLLCYGTVAGGFLSERWLGKPEPNASALGNWSQMKYKRFIDAAGGWVAFQNLLYAVDAIARQYKVSISNIACRYILEQPAVGGIIIGARLGENAHVSDNLRLFQFALDEASHASLRAAMKKLQPIPGDCGDEYRQPPFLTASGDLSHHLNSMPLPYVAETTANGRSKILSGTVWEDLAGFCRAVRVGNHICISGTTATHGNRAIGGTDAAAQLHFIIDKIEGALHSLGARLKHVIRTRLFVRHLADWEAVARAHGERFRGIQPANTLVQAGLVGDEYLVEMEAEAVVDSAD